MLQEELQNWQMPPPVILLVIIPLGQLIAQLEPNRYWPGKQEVQTVLDEHVEQLLIQIKQVILLE